MPRRSAAFQYRFQRYRTEGAATAARFRTSRRACCLAHERQILDIRSERLEARTSRKNARSAGGAWYQPSRVRLIGLPGPATPKSVQAGVLDFSGKRAGDSTFMQHDNVR